ncbi:hypothetical protein [Novosphingobium cyanobacteriorum]|uniref:UspA domain-containing protein n=1 Tax=Novosphingobium cyanobacteriorum TaxID=3024215 RepID=A0ABT6CN25_9SPHN|nr:hypothetical protein [Novosphingobium cyanobacteriorum]MDF8334973.1 hypothetical protein [Novosphingobium cyanobacteriorum]
MLFAVDASSSKWPDIFAVISRVANLRRSHLLHVALRVPPSLMRESLRLRDELDLDDCLDLTDALSELPEGILPQTAASFVRIVI